MLEINFQKRFELQILLSLATGVQAPQAQCWHLCSIITKVQSKVRTHWYPTEGLLLQPPPLASKFLEAYPILTRPLSNHLVNLHAKL